MTLATLRKLEWADTDRDGNSYCPACKHEVDVHAPDCELVAEIREAERRETGERPEIQVGDVVETKAGNLDRVTAFDVREWNHRRGFHCLVAAIYRDPLWRQEAPTP